MEFFEFVLIFSFAFVLPLTILKTILDYKKARHRGGTGEGSGAGVTAGELKRLLREAVEDANAPLLARIDDLEDQLSLPTRRDSHEDKLEPDPLEMDPQERTLGRRVAE